MVRSALTPLVVVFYFSIAKSRTICSTTGVHCLYDGECCSGFCNEGSCSWITSGLKEIPGVKTAQYDVKTYDPTVKQVYVIKTIASDENGLSGDKRKHSESVEDSSGSSSIPYCDEIDYSSSLSDVSYSQSRKYSENELSESGVSADERSGDSSPEIKKEVPEDPSNNNTGSDHRKFPEQDWRPNVNRPDINISLWQCTEDSDFCRQDSECCSRLCQNFRCDGNHPGLEKAEVEDESGSWTSSIYDSQCGRDYLQCNKDSDCCSQECFAGTNNGGICVPANPPVTFPLNDRPKQRERATIGYQSPDPFAVGLWLPQVTHQMTYGYPYGEVYPPASTLYSQRPSMNNWQSPNSLHPFQSNTYFPYFYQHGKPQHYFLRPFGQQIPAQFYPLDINYPPKGLSDADLRDNVNMYESDISLADIQPGGSPTRTYSMESTLDMLEERLYDSYMESIEAMPGKHFIDHVDRGNYGIYQVPQKAPIWPPHAVKGQVDPFRKPNFNNKFESRNVFSSHEFGSSPAVEFPYPYTESNLAKSVEGNYDSSFENEEDPNLSTDLSDNDEESYIDTPRVSLEKDKDRNFMTDSDLLDYSEENYVNIDLSKHLPQTSVILPEHGIKGQVIPIERYPSLTDIPRRSPTYPMKWMQYGPLSNTILDHFYDYDKRPYQKDSYLIRRIYTPPKSVKWLPNAIKGQFNMYGSDNIQPQFGFRDVLHEARIADMPNIKPPARTYSMDSTVDASDEHYYMESIETEETTSMVPEEYLRDFGPEAYPDISKISQIPQKSIIVAPHGIKGHAIYPFNDYVKEKDFKDSSPEYEYSDASDFAFDSVPTRTLSVESSEFSSDEHQYSLYEETQEFEDQPNLLPGNTSRRYEEGSYQSDISTVYDANEIPRKIEFELSNEKIDDIHEVREDYTERKEEAGHESELSIVDGLPFTSLPAREFEATSNVIDEYQHNSLNKSIEVDQSNELQEEYSHGYDEGGQKSNDHTYETREMPQQPLVDPSNEVKTEKNKHNIDEMEINEHDDTPHDYELPIFEDLPLNTLPTSVFEPHSDITIKEHSYNELEESFEFNEDDPDEYEHFVDSHIHEEQEISHQMSKEINAEFDSSIKGYIENNQSAELVQKREPSSSRYESTIDRISERNNYNSMKDFIEPDQSNILLEEHLKEYPENYKNEIDTSRGRKNESDREKFDILELKIDNMDTSLSMKLAGSDNPPSHEITGNKPQDLHDYNDNNYPYSYAESEERNLEKNENTHESVLSDEVEEVHQGSPLGTILPTSYDEPSNILHSLQESIEELPHVKDDNYIVRNISSVFDTYSEEFVVEKESKQRHRNSRKRMCKHKKCRHRKRHKKCKIRLLKTNYLPSEDIHPKETGSTSVPKRLAEHPPPATGTATEEFIQKTNSKEAVKSSNGLGFAGWITHGARSVVG